VAQSAREDPTSTFVVRLWPERSAAGLRWRGRIDHVQSGESAAFLDADGMVDFIRRFSALDDDKRQATRADG
jgi:hypothetical protein